MSVKDILKNSPVTRGLYARYKTEKEKRAYAYQFGYTGEFKNRSRNAEKLCIMLAGYKAFSYPAVFGRLKRFAPADLDVCIVTSGKYSEEIDKICQENNWSYLSTKENNVALVQNAALSLHPNAKYIYKLDEDIFITENYFENMMRAYLHAKEGLYVPGIMAPLIPINGYGHMRVLEKLGLTELYAEKFETPKYMAGPHRMIENSPDVARFMWGEGGYIPSIDELNARFATEPLEEKACPIRFSIGAILFERQLLEDMGYFSVDRKTSNMGVDEVDICSFCLIKSRPLMVSENIVVGHLSFGTQNEPMRQYYEKHSEQFL